MGPMDRRSYLLTVRPRYLKAGRAEKVQILNEFCAVCGYHRKYATNLMNKPVRVTKKGKPGRKSKYRGQRFSEVLQRIWHVSDFMCSRRLKAIIPEWLPSYEEEYKPVDGETKALLLTVSTSTLDRILKPLRGRLGRGLYGTKPGTLLKTQIPIRTDNWDITVPGFMEADTVAHCGSSLAGDFVWSLTMTDIHTGWTECRAVWNKAAMGVIEQVHDIERNLPFKLRGFDCDNGSEFLNHHLVRYFTNRKVPVGFTRSRPYKKNDNAHVEQKNWTHPRQLLGYDRIDNPALVAQINDLYANEFSLYQNYFCPSMKLVSKTRLNSKYKRTYDDPRTPYQRLIASGKRARSTQKMLADIKKSINPFKLKKAIDRKAKAIFKNLRSHQI